MNYTSEEIANILDGTVEGNHSETVHSIAKIEEGKKGDLCFLSNPKYNSYLYSSKASIVIVNKNIQLDKEVNTTLIKVDDAYLAFTKILEMYQQHNNTKEGVSKKSDISKSAKLGEKCYIAPFVFLGENVKIGKNVQIHPHCFIGDNVEIKDNSTLFSGVKIYHNCIIGSENVIHSGSVIGADGFGFAPNSEGNYNKIQHIGNVVTHDFVEIGANTTIDRATLGSTIIYQGVKLDNQIQVGHNVEIGKHTVIAALTAIAGSTKIGKNCMIGGQTAIAGHLKIGNFVKVAGKSGIASNIKDGETIQGSLAFNQKDFLRSYIIFKKLPEIYKTMESLKNEFIK